MHAINFKGMDSADSEPGENANFSKLQKAPVWFMECTFKTRADGDVLKPLQR